MYLTRTVLALAAVAALLGTSVPALALEYPYAPYNEGKLDPQLTGWPLSAAALEYVAKPTHQRRPGTESGGQKMAFLPYTPSADGSGAPNWYVSAHGTLVASLDRFKQEHSNKVDILLVGDSITWQWIDIRAPYNQYPQQFNEAWKTAFGQYTAFNLGVAGDKTQGLLWRLDRGGVLGSTQPPLAPRLVILAIGHNNMFFTGETGTLAAAQGVLWCVKNLRAKFPQTPVIVCKIFPSHTPKAAFYQNAREINTHLDALFAAEQDPQVHLLPDLWAEMTQPEDGRVRPEFFRADEKDEGKIHLSLEGYRLWASKLKPLVDRLLTKR
jgi:beta-glucosidase